MKTFNARFGAWALLITLLSSPFAGRLTAQTTFTNVTDTVLPGLANIGYSSVAWGDYDNDGRRDLLLGGYSPQVLRNTGSGFTNVTASVATDLTGLAPFSAAWGDYDNDGRLDILLTGATNYVSGTWTGFVSQVWRNTGNG